MVVLAGDSIREWCKRRSDHHANDLPDQSADIVERTTCHRGQKLQQLLFYGGRQSTRRIEANETEEKDRMEKDEKVPHDSSASTTKKHFGNLRASTEIASQVQVDEAAIMPIYPHAT